MRRTGTEEQERAVRADPGAEGTGHRPALVPGQKAPEGLTAGGQGIPYPRSASGLAVVLDRRSYRNKACGGMRTAASVDAALAHRPSTRSARQRRPCGEGAATAPRYRDRGGPRLWHPARATGWRRDRAGTCAAGGGIAGSASHPVIPWAPTDPGRAKRVRRGPRFTCCALRGHCPAPSSTP